MEWNIQALNPGMVNERLLFNSIHASQSHKYTALSVSQRIPLKEVILCCVRRNGVYLQQKYLSPPSAQCSNLVLRATQPPTQCATWFHVITSRFDLEPMLRTSGVIRQPPLCTLTLSSPQNRSGSFAVEKNILHPGIRVTDSPSRSLTTSTKYATLRQIKLLHKNIFRLIACFQCPQRQLIR
jgi:hypothetical protein